MQRTLITSLTVLAAATSLVAQDDAVSYTFQTPPMNGQGLRSLDELRGTPVLVEFWGVN